MQHRKLAKARAHVRLLLLVPRPSREYLDDKDLNIVESLDEAKKTLSTWVHWIPYASV